MLTIIYVADCLWWLPWNSCVIEQWWPGDIWRLRTTSDWAATRNRALIALTPWPTGIGLEVGPSSLSLSPDGFVFWCSTAWTTKGRPRQSVETWVWPEVRSVTARGEKILVNEETAVTQTSEREAIRLARLLNEVCKADAAERKKLIAELRSDAADPDIISDRITEALDSMRLLRWGGAVQGTLLLIVAPIILTRFGGPIVLGSIGGAALITALFNVVLFLKGHRQAFPEERWERMESALVMFFCWPVAIRAAAALIRHQLAGFDPLAVLMATEGLKGRDQFVGMVLRDLQHPLGLDELPSQARSIVEWQLQSDQGHIRQLSARAGIEITDEDVSKTAAASGAAYCPRCLATYRRHTGKCADCPGVELHDHEKQEEKGA